jgi:formylglycine-generating enzyme required for sulfatase activity
VAETREGPERDLLRLRAGSWYRRAAAQLAGLAGLRVKQRLEELAKLDREIPAAPTPAKAPQSPPLAVAPFDERTAKGHQAAWAEHLGVPVVWKNSIGMEFMLIPPGEFMMGCDPRLPVERVSWEDATEFCRRLSALSQERSDGSVYRLPTEAEWEYACRAGTTTIFSFGDSAESLGDYAWYVENSGRRTQPVGGKKPNAWGLYDMHGNVWEWCMDWHDSAYYAKSPPEDPWGPSSGATRALRGGGFTCNHRIGRPAHRHAVRQVEKLFLPSGGADAPPAVDR